MITDSPIYIDDMSACLPREGGGLGTIYSSFIRTLLYYIGQLFTWKTAHGVITVRFWSLAVHIFKGDYATSTEEIDSWRKRLPLNTSRP